VERGGVPTTVSGSVQLFPLSALMWLRFRFCALLTGIMILFTFFSSFFLRYLWWLADQIWAFALLCFALLNIYLCLFLPCLTFLFFFFFATILLIRTACTALDVSLVYLFFLFPYHWLELR